jgi:heme-degrading monooxygenase HmoA
MMTIQTESDMIKLANLDNNISIIDQLGEHESPAILVNVFTVDPSETDRVMEAWIRDAEFMKRQRGFIWTQLHRGIGRSSTFMNYAVWEDVDAFKTAFEHPEFRRQLADYPPSAVARPLLFRKISVPGICVSS